MIEVADLTKSYGSVQALAGVSFQVKSGEIVGLLGPNGAGKSTTIKILTGYLQPDDGIVKVDNLDVLTQTQQVQERIGYLPEIPPVYPELTVQSYLLMIADLRAIPRSEQQKRISEAVYATGLTEHLIRPIGQLSKGFRQRVGLAQAILHQPKLLILDEPTAGLDPTQIIEIRHLIRRLAQTSTILFSSHILSEVEAVCDRVIIIMNGEVKADASLSELAKSREAVLILEKDVPQVIQTLKSLGKIQDVEQEQTSEGYPLYRIRSDEEIELGPAIYRLARQEDWPVYELRHNIRTLEAVYSDLTTGGENETDMAHHS